MPESRSQWRCIATRWPPITAQDVMGFNYEVRNVPTSVVKLPPEGRKNPSGTRHKRVVCLPPLVDLG